MATTPAWPDLQTGSSGKNVSALQCLLTFHGYSLTIDGSFGPGTRTAVINFQNSRGLTANGVAGANTLSALIVTVQNGAVNYAARAVQYLLSKFETITVDGSFGPNSVTVTRTFQQKMGISVDGSVGPTTWQYLFGYSAYPGGGGGTILSMPAGKNCNWNQKHSSVTQYFGTSACTLVAGLDVANFYSTNANGYTPADMNSTTYWTSGGYTWAVPGPGAIGSKVCENSSKATCLARIKSEIDAGKPVIVNIGSSSNNHTVFAYGYTNGAADYTDIMVYDPANMDTSNVNGRVVNLYNAMDYNGDKFTIWSLRPTYSS